MPPNSQSIYTFTTTGHALLWLAPSLPGSEKETITADVLTVSDIIGGVRPIFPVATLPDLIC